MNQNADLILVGAGLANCLLAWTFKDRHPTSKILIFEADTEIMKARTWSFHRSDLAPETYNQIAPLVSKEWKGYTVFFRKFSREFESGYASIRPQDLEAKMRTRFGSSLRFNTKVRSLDAHAVTLDNGDVFRAPCVIDGRGLNAFAQEKAGYQKFFGMHVGFSSPHGLTKPILMDATVPQTDGYRFVYVLPWGDNEALIEDTYYSEKPHIDLDRSERAIREYASAQGWTIESVLSRESGSLPLPLHPLPFAKRVQETGAPRYGVSGGFFHPVTGYSLPDAARLAERIAVPAHPTSESVRTILETYFEERAPDWKYLCLLNRLMFEAAKPEERFRVLQHFYQLPDSLVANFYRGALTVGDRIRILSGKPPVPMGAALKCIWSSGL